MAYVDDVLDTAIRAGQPVTITYGGVTRQVYPEGFLTTKSGSELLVAQTDAGYRRFRLDAIDDVQSTQDEE